MMGKHMSLKETSKHKGEFDYFIDNLCISEDDNYIMVEW